MAWRISLFLLLITSGHAVQILAADAIQAPGNPATSAAVLEVPDNISNVGLQPIDWVLITIYACSTIGLGWYYSRRQQTTQEYFVGSGTMHPMLIGVSLFATLLSTITYLAAPGEMLGKGPVVLASKLSLPFAYVFVGYCLLPIYMKQRVTSAYELLETRLGLGIRLLGATMFILLRLVWMSLLVYLAAKAMIVMMGIDEKWIWLVVMITGAISVTYTTLGGLRAVVITDLIQTCLLFSGALLVIATVTYEFGGFGWFPTSWHENWDTQPIFSLDPQTRVTFVGSFLSVLVWFIATSGGDQTSIQRFMATKDARAARRAYATQLTVSVLVTVILSLVGCALLAHAERNVTLLPDGFDLKQNADDVFPWYIAYRLPMGISGLVVSAMFAAAMSSIDSGVNSITAVVTTDLFDRFGLRPQTVKGHLRCARLLALGIGTLVVIGSSYMEHIPGNITAVTSKTNNLLVTPIFCLFFFAVLVPFAKPAGVLAGAVCGTTVAALIAFSGPLTYLLYDQFGIDPTMFGTELIEMQDKVTGEIKNSCNDPVSFQWIGPIALIVNIATGTIVSLIQSAFQTPSRVRHESS